MQPPSGSVAFDRATGYYDRTRAHSVAAQEALTRALADQLADRGPVLEIGVGTGRIARPLAAEGVDVLGLDLSGPMLRKLVDNAGGRRPFPLLQGDATRLPFATGTVGGVIAWHVFHLIPPWMDAVAEARRVIRPGGTLVVARGGWEGLAGEISTAFCESAGLGSKPVVGLDEVADLDDHLGIEPEVHGPIHDTQHRTLDEVIGFLEAGMPAWTWTLTETERATAGERTRSWARDAIGPLDQPREVIRPITWRTYTLP